MAVIGLVNSLFRVYELILLTRVILSWFPTLDWTHPVVQFIYRATEPVLRPIRNLFPSGLILDFSPLIVFLLLPLVRQIVIRLLYTLLVY